MKEQFKRVTEATLDDIRIKDIEGYEGKYAITSCGRVWNYSKKRFVPQWHNGTDYWLVTLCKNGEKLNRRVHRLVAQAYLPNPDNLPKVDHKDTNPSHNYLGNLRWVDNVINYCNRKRNIPVLDAETGEIHCSLSKAVRLTNISRRKIIRDCELYRETKKEARFIYLSDLSEEEMLKILVRLHLNNIEVA